ncbi:hypothetical protein GCM10020254_40290 [Streptomyces goshikiensis]
MNLLPTATSTDVEDRQPRVAVLPVGSFEQHGRYLPLITDTAIACIIGQEVADAYPVHLLPPITMSCSHEHAAFPGTVSISAKTLFAVIDDIRASLARSGISKLVIINGHGGNYVLSNIVQEANVDGPAVSLFPLSADWDRARDHASLDSDRHADMHAGEIETSILLHAAPELVREGNANADHDGGPPSLPPSPGHEGVHHIRRDRLSVLRHRGQGQSRAGQPDRQLRRPLRSPRHERLKPAEPTRTFLEGFLL